MKITIITVMYNAEQFLHACVQSVVRQSHPDIEYIVIDGGSQDSSLSIISEYHERVNLLISEKDAGIYDAINKGLSMATGEVIGLMHADDFFADDHVLTDVAEVFANKEADLVYGDLWFVNRLYPEKIVRKWISQPYNRTAMSWGWMPAHPTFYARRRLFEKLGNYNLTFNSAADYELMLRFLYLNKSKSVYLDRVFVKMRTGGLSNRSVKNRLQANLSDLKAMRHHNIKLPWLKVLIKPLRKVSQYLVF
jgi:glycosyltransferase involved in cell wall biosynthesis